MADEFLGERKRALEEEFFRKREQAILQRLAGERARQTAREALAAASGLKDEAVLDHLLNLGIEPDTLLALGLVPLVEVAWADGHLDDRERRAILFALGQAGVASDSASYALVQGWLATSPPPAMLEAWAAYTAGLCAQLSPTERADLRAAVMGRARTVAQAAGGFLGLGKVSPDEEEMLRRLERAFAG